MRTSPFECRFPFTRGPVRRALRQRWSVLATLAAVPLALLQHAPIAAAQLSAAAAADTASVVLVAFYSQTGNTEAMARAAAEGAAEIEGVQASLVAILDVTPDDLNNASGLIVASPTHWANLPPAVTEFIAKWPFLGGKVAGAIATAGNPGGGSEHVLLSLIGAFLNHGALVIGPVFEDGGRRFGWMGAAALTGPVGPGVGPVELDGARRLGRRVAQAVRAAVAAGIEER